jgi:polygalacturonase
LLIPFFSPINLLVRRDFQPKRKEYNIIDYGAVGDNATLCTEFIQNAIDDAAVDGGRVIVPAGEFLTGTVFLRSGVDLYLNKDAMLSGSQRDEDYPELTIFVRGERLSRIAGLVTAMYSFDISVAGEGMINGNGKIWWSKFWGEDKKGGVMAEYEAKGIRWAADRAVRRPRSIYFCCCHNISISGITMIRSGSWNVHIHYSHRVLIDSITIYDNDGPSTDGIDIDSTSEALIQNCDIDCNDDNICIKAGRDLQGIRIGIPSENIVIRDCITRAGHGLVTLGSETAGCIRNVLAYNLKAYGTRFGLRFKSAKNRGGVVENITMRNMYIEKSHMPIRFDINWFPAFSYAVIPEDYKDKIPENWFKSLEPVPPEIGIPKFRNIIISNIEIRNCENGLVMEGLPEEHVRNVTLENIDAEVEHAGKIQYFDNLHLCNVSVRAKDGSDMEIIDCKNFLYQ